LERILEPFYTTKPDGMAWDFRSVARSSKPMEDGCGRRGMSHAGVISVYASREPNLEIVIRIYVASSHIATIAIPA
jgi:hypothetical protein